jgi:hypothetical protein
LRSDSEFLMGKNSAGVRYRVNAMSMTPAQPPPMNTANVHQTEIMSYLFWPRASC